jgi:hypothetical protein
MGSVTLDLIVIEPLNLWWTLMLYQIGNLLLVVKLLFKGTYRTDYLVVEVL